MRDHSPVSEKNKTITQSPFHPGEQELQTRTGKRDQVESIGRKIIRSYMPEQHRQFYSQLPFMVIGSVDNQGWPWASLLPGKPGFVQSATPTTLDISTQAIKGDPLSEALKTLDAPLGLLGIELNTGRRNRVNGRVIESSRHGIRFKVGQSFGNCSKYIQHRSINFIADAGETSRTDNRQIFSVFDHQARSLIKAADTFFVASFVEAKDHPNIEGVDVSHRGGQPGFVKIDANTLTVPDYSGNYLFNTLGNFLINPKAGLIFIDYTSGQLLMLTGTVELLWKVNKENQSLQGANRAWRFTLDHGIRLNDALAFKATLAEPSAKQHVLKS